MKALNGIMRIKMNKKEQELNHIRRAFLAGVDSAVVNADMFQYDDFLKPIIRNMYLYKPNKFKTIEEAEDFYRKDKKPLFEYENGVIKGNEGT